VRGGWLHSRRSSCMRWDTAFGTKTRSNEHFCAGGFVQIVDHAGISSVINIRCNSQRQR
jgi:hypothetical protein